MNWDKHFSSDWLSSFADITLDAPSDSSLSALLSATYEITSGPIGSGSVYFDDISVVTLEAVPSLGRCGSLYLGIRISLQCALMAVYNSSYPGCTYMCMYVIIKYVSIKYIFTCTERIKELVVNSIICTYTKPY